MNRLAIIGSSNIKYNKCYGSMGAIIEMEEPDIIVSGGAYGADKISEDIAKELNIKTDIYLPKTNDWDGYKERNILIAENCDKLYNFVIKDDKSYCYHHKRGGHIKSGGCWTENYAKQLGKQVTVIEI